MFHLSRRTSLFLLAGAPLALAACAQGDENKADAGFKAIGDKWLEGALRLSPVFATGMGEHRYDAELDDLSAAGRKAQVDFSKQILGELEALEKKGLSKAAQVDAALLTNNLRYGIWDVEVLQSWAWDPIPYNSFAGGALYGLMSREFAPIEARLKSAIGRMVKLPGAFAQMREALDPKRVPKVHADTVASQNRGLISLVDGEVMSKAGALTGADRQAIDAAAKGLKAAVEEHQAWLDKTLVPNAAGDFRLGQKLYDEKLAFALFSPLSRADIKARSEAGIADTRSQMYEVSRKALAGKAGAPAAPENPDAATEQKVVAAAFAISNAQRPARDKVVEACQQALAQATAFVREKDFVTVPDAPVKVIVMPEFQRGVAVAYCDAPGPLDRGQATYFAVSPIPDDWSQERVDSFLKEYNSRAIHELAIHEAMPGHYLQLDHANAYPSPLRAVLQSGPFIEGWAVYSEKVMADSGYLDRDPLYLLAYLKLKLRGQINALLDQAVHVDGIERDAAMKLMTETGFQEEREAAGKWVRAQVSSAQLPVYFVGYEEHLAARAAAEQAWGDKFTEKRYHDGILSFGSPPVRYAQALLLDEPVTT